MRRSGPGSMNRRDFIKTGLSAAAVLPAAGVLLRASQATSLTCLAAFAFGADARLPELRIKESSAERILMQVDHGGTTYTIAVDPEGETASLSKNPA